MAETGPVAAFDFDGTLTTADTFLPFLARAAGPQALASGLARAGLAWRREGRDRAKETVVAAGLAGRAIEHLEQLGQTHAERVWTQTKARPWAPGLRPNVVERVRRHQQLGHRVVIVSASLRLYVEPVAARLGIDDVVATELDVDEHGRCTGRLAGSNCRGQEKVERLEAAVAPDWERAWGYGDSQGDAAMLAKAANAVWVKRGLLDGPSPT